MTAIAQPIALTAALALAAPRPGERVLDLACGEGTGTFIAAELVGVQGWVLGVDADEPAL